MTLSFRKSPHLLEAKTISLSPSKDLEMLIHEKGYEKFGRTHIRNEGDPCKYIGFLLVQRNSFLATSLLCRLPSRLSVLVLWWPTRRKSIFVGKLSNNLLTIPLTVSQVQVPLPLTPHIVSHLPVEPSHLLL